MGPCVCKDADFEATDADNSGGISVKEMETFVSKYQNGQLWEKLQLKMGLPAEEPQKTATHAAWTLAGGKNCDELTHSQVNPRTVSTSSTVNELMFVPAVCTCEVQAKVG